MDDKNFKLEEFNKSVLSGTATWWQMRLPSGDVFFGDAKARMLGYPDEMFKKYTDFTALVHPDDVDATMNAMKDHLSGKKKYYETVYRIKNKAGEYIKFYDCGKITGKEGNNITVAGFVLKISEDADIFEQMEKFKDIIFGGDTSIIELVSKIK